MGRNNEKAADSLAGHIDGNTIPSNQLQEGTSIMSPIQHRREMKKINLVIMAEYRRRTPLADNFSVSNKLGVSRFTAWRVLTGRKSLTFGQLDKLVKGTRSTASDYCTILDNIKTTS